MTPFDQQAGTAMRASASTGTGPGSRLSGKAPGQGVPRSAAEGQIPFSSPSLRPFSPSQRNRFRSIRTRSIPHDHPLPYFPHCIRDAQGARPPRPGTDNADRACVAPGQPFCDVRRTSRYSDAGDRGVLLEAAGRQRRDHQEANHSPLISGRPRHDPAHP